MQIRVAVSSPSGRGVDVYVPLADWGLRARVIGAPVKIAAEPRRVDRQGVVGLVTGATEVSRLRGQLDDAIGDAVLRAVLLSLAGGLAGGIVAGLALRPRRIWIAPLGGFAIVAVVLGGLAAWSAITWEPDRLERPRYFASGVELERIVDQAQSLRRSGEKYADRVDSAVLSIAGLLDERSVVAETEAADGERTRIALASDIHNNLFTLRTLRRYSADLPTVLAGDFTINGGRLESPLAATMAGVGDPVVAVSGNHDSPGIMRALAGNGARVLDHEDGVVEIAGLAMAGFEDPLAFAAGDFPPGIRAGISFGDIPDGDERFAAAVEERWRWWQQLPRRPQVLVLHQAALGRELAERIRDADPEAAPVAILVGHTHRQALETYGNVTLVNSGSIGAGGVFGLGTQSVGLALLDFRDGALEAVDLIAQNPATKSARAQHVVIASPDCDGELVICHG